jgi:uncharacterized protein YbjQ (UPF0145 family)
VLFSIAGPAITSATWGAQFRTLAGGEVAGYTKLLSDSCNQAREWMWHEARARDANAIVGMRFDRNEIGGIVSEIAAYGTAVTVEPVEAISPGFISEPYVSRAGMPSAEGPEKGTATARANINM